MNSEFNFGKSSKDQANLLIFSLGGSKYSIQSLNVLQILQTVQTTPVSNSAPYVIGSTNFRGEVSPVIDLGMFFFGSDIATQRSEADQHLFAFIGIQYMEKSVIFRVESVVGTTPQPDESLVTDLIEFADPSEMIYFNRAFILQEEIIVQVALDQILERIEIELREFQKQFNETNLQLLTNLSLPDDVSEYNIELQQNIATPLPTGSVISAPGDQTVKQGGLESGTLVQSENLKILIPSKQIVEIATVSAITAVPNASKAVLGAVNFRGTVISVLSFRVMLDLGNKGQVINESLKEGDKIVVLEVGDQQLGLYVDAVHEMWQIDSTKLNLTLPSMKGDQIDYFFNGTYLDGSGNIILLLNVDYIFNKYSDEQTLAKASSQLVFFDRASQSSVTSSKSLESSTRRENALLQFTLSGAKFSIPSDHVIQLLQSLTITPITKSVPYLIGSTSFQGEILPVIDLQAFFYDTILEQEKNESQSGGNFIVIEHQSGDGGATAGIVVQVEHVLGTVEKPEEQFVTDLVHLANPLENPYFSQAFLHGNEIIVQIDRHEILDRINRNLITSRIQFDLENQRHLSAIETIESLEGYSIDLKEKLSSPAAFGTGFDREGSTREISRVSGTGTLVTVKELQISVPNQQIIEIFNVPKVTSVPNASRAMMGAVNFRGDVISVLNLAEVLGIELDSLSEQVLLEPGMDILVVEASNQQLGLYVEEIHQIWELDPSRVQQIYSTQVKQQHFFEGAYVDPSNQIILVLNVEYILTNYLVGGTSSEAVSQLIYLDKPSLEMTTQTEDLVRLARGRDHLLRFTLNGETFSIPSDHVVQILQSLTITPITKSVPYLIGSTSFHGEILPVIDLQAFFYDTHLEQEKDEAESRGNFIVIEHKSEGGGATAGIVVQVEHVLGSVEKPEEQFVTDLVHLANPLENSYFSQAFLHDNEIIVQIDREQIRDRINQELISSRIQFDLENQRHLSAIETIESLEGDNIDLKEKLSSPAAFGTGFDREGSTREISGVSGTGTLVAVKELQISVPTQQIIEIFNVPRVTSVPNASREMMGAVNFRGDVISVLNLAEVLGIELDSLNGQVLLEPGMDILVVEANNQQLGLYVNAVHQIYELDPSRVQQIYSTQVKQQHFFEGAYVDPSNQIVLVLNVEYILKNYLDEGASSEAVSQLIYLDKPSLEMTTQTEDLVRLARGEDHLLRFTLNGETFSVVSQNVSQILQSLTLTPITNSAPYLVGSTTYQGDILPVIDLQSFFYQERIEDSPELIVNGHFIVLREQQQLTDFVQRGVIFQVEKILSTIEKPADKDVTDLVHMVDPLENPYYDQAFINKKEIIVQINQKEILGQITDELKTYRKQFQRENETLLSPIEFSERWEEVNFELGLGQTSSAPSLKSVLAPHVLTGKKHRPTGTLIVVRDFEIIIPNENIVEIFNASNISIVPNAGRVMIGAINFRGNVISVISLARLLNITMPSSDFTRAFQERGAEVIIFDFKGQNMALYVDAVKELIDLDNVSIRHVINPITGGNPEYIFKGVTLGSGGRILPVLSVDYIFTQFTDPHKPEPSLNQIVYFEKLEESLVSAKEGIEGEGVIFVNNGNQYYLNAENVVQVFDFGDILFKEYRHPAIVGAVIHSRVSPLMDFSILLEGARNTALESKKSVAILINDPDKNTDYALLVDEIIDRIPLEKLDSYETEVRFARNSISPLISGFFSYQNKLGMIISSEEIFRSANAILGETLNITDTHKEFPLSLADEERTFLEQIQESRKELELLLFYGQEGTRLEYLLFELVDSNCFALDVNMVSRVISDANIKALETTNPPILGTAMLDEKQLPVLDLSDLLLHSNVISTTSGGSFYFSLTIQDIDFLIPVKDIQGVATTFKEELLPCEDHSIFLEGKEACQFTMTTDRLSETIYIIDQAFLEKIFANKGIFKIVKSLNL